MVVRVRVRVRVNSLGSRAAQVPSALTRARSSCRWVAPARTTMIAPEEGAQLCRGVLRSGRVQRCGGAAVQRRGEVQRGGRPTARPEHTAELIPRRGREATEDDVEGAVGKGQAVPGGAAKGVELGQRGRIPASHGLSGTARLVPSARSSLAPSRVCGEFGASPRRPAQRHGATTTALPTCCRCGEPTAKRAAGCRLAAYLQGRSSE